MNMDTYCNIRPYMKTGDLLLWKSHSILGAAIRYFSKSNVNHASLVIPLSGQGALRIFTLEALEKGIVPNFLSHRLTKYDGEVYWYPLKDEWDSNRAVIEALAFKHIGVPYDYKSLFKQAFSRVSADVRHLFCSEYCYVCYGMEGQAPRPGDMPGLGIFKSPIKIL